MRSTYVVSTTGLAARRVAFGLTAVIVALAIGLALALWAVSRAGQGTDGTRVIVPVNYGYGAGYPPHGGLAGPSQVRSGARHPSYGPGYPSHGGLAGPSRAGSEP